MPATIRVLHLIKSLGRGGAEVLLPEGLRFADRDRFDYRYAYFLPWKDAVVPRLTAQGAPVTCYGARNNAEILLAARRVAASLREQSVDVLHCHLPVAGAVGRIAGRMAGVPVVYTEHNKQERYHAATRWLNALTWRWQDRVIAVSTDVADSIAGYMAPTVPVEVVLNGVDVDHFRRGEPTASSAREALGISEAAPVIGTVAVFRAQKKLDDWLEAARRIRDRHPDAHFVIVGDGPLREELVARASALGLLPVVHFTGLHEDVRPFLAMMDVYLMSSRFEGLPVALLEAMSMECAPVCTAVGGIPEVIRHGENGLLVAPGDPASLAAAVTELLQDDRRAALRASARRTVVERFGMARMTNEIERIYLDVVESHRGSL